MANLKLDLLNKLRNDKYYEELELVRLAQEPNMNYNIKIGLMVEILKDISMLNAQMGLMEQYFNEPDGKQQAAPPAQPQAAPVVQKPAGTVHQGQSHGE